MQLPGPIPVDAVVGLFCLRLDGSRGPVVVRLLFLRELLAAEEFLVKLLGPGPVDLVPCRGLGAAHAGCEENCQGESR